MSFTSLLSWLTLACSRLASLQGVSSPAAVVCDMPHECSSMLCVSIRLSDNNIFNRFIKKQYHYCTCYYFYNSFYYYFLFIAPAFIIYYSLFFILMPFYFLHFQLLLQWTFNGISSVQTYKELPKN